MEELLNGLFQLIQNTTSDVFQLIFGEWNYQVLFNWLPQDIQTAVDTFMIILFGLALVKIIRHFIPM